MPSVLVSRRLFQREGSGVSEPSVISYPRSTRTSPSRNARTCSWRCGRPEARHPSSPLPPHARNLLRHSDPPSTSTPRTLCRETRERHVPPCIRRDPRVDRRGDAVGNAVREQRRGADRSSSQSTARTSSPAGSTLPRALSPHSPPPGSAGERHRELRPACEARDVCAQDSGARRHSLPGSAEAASPLNLLTVKASVSSALDRRWKCCGSVCCSRSQRVFFRRR